MNDDKWKAHYERRFGKPQHHWSDTLLGSLAVILMMASAVSPGFVEDPVNALLSCPLGLVALIGGVAIIGFISFRRHQ